MIFDASDVLSLIEKIDGLYLSLEKKSDELPEENKGPSGRKFRTLLNELNKRLPDGIAYLELGILRGKSILTSCLANPNTHHIGIDNFSQFDPNGDNYNLIQDAIALHNISNIEIIADDFEKYLIERGRNGQRNIGVYFYDAIHDYRSQLFALIQAHNVIADGGIILVDDTNYGHVRYATYDFISAFSEFKLIFESYTGMHPNEMSSEELSAAREGWWNGVHVIMHDPKNQLEGLQPVYEEGIHNKFHETLLLTKARSLNMERRLASIKFTE